MFWRCYVTSVMSFQTNFGHLKQSLSKFTPTKYIPKAEDDSSTDLIIQLLITSLNLTEIHVEFLTVFFI